MKPRMLVLALGVALGYVLGTRAGRGRYDQLKAVVMGYWEDPRVAKARKDVTDYSKQQAPVIRERAETVAKDVAGKTTSVAKDVAAKTSETAKDIAAKTSETAKDIADAAKDVAAKTAATAKDVAGTARDVATDLRDRGGAAVETVVTAVATARDKFLDTLEDDEHDDADAGKSDAGKDADRPASQS
jgi:hypothetical protein